MSVVIVMPSLAVSDDGNPPIVATIIFGLVVLVPEYMGCRVHKPSGMEYGNHPNTNHPHKPGQSEFGSANQITCASDQRTKRNMDWQEPSFEHDQKWLLQKIRYPFLCISLGIAIVGCKGQPKHMCPPGTFMRRMRISWLVTVRMVFAMVGRPTDRSAFTSKCA
jgi:hypothetical protein